MAVTTESVWKAISDNIFGVLAFTNAAGEPRSAGVVYTVHDRGLLVSSGRDSWKNRHIARSPKVSMTVAIPKRIPFLPFVRVPAATITFRGDAEILEVGDLPTDVTQRMFKSSRLTDDEIDGVQVIRIIPQGSFLTYGIGMPITRMASHESAIDRVPCRTDRELMFTA